MDGSAVPGLGKCCAQTRKLTNSDLPGSMGFLGGRSCGVDAGRCGIGPDLVSDFRVSQRRPGGGADDSANSVHSNS